MKSALIDSFDFYLFFFVCLFVCLFFFFFAMSQNRKIPEFQKDLRIFISNPWVSMSKHVPVKPHRGCLSNFSFIIKDLIDTIVDSEWLQRRQIFQPRWTPWTLLTCGKVDIDQKKNKCYSTHVELTQISKCLFHPERK